MLFIVPFQMYIFHRVMSDAKITLSQFSLRKMIAYISNDGTEMPLHSRELWSSILRWSVHWLIVLSLAALILGIFQWYVYSGSFIFNDASAIESTLNTGTGVDWNVAWVINPDLSSSVTVVFSLVMYSLYAVGWWITFAFYIFLFRFFSEMENMARATNLTIKRVLRLWPNDAASGGFGKFRDIQHRHFVFCALSIASMYLMSLRNTFLQNVCKTPIAIQDQYHGVDLVQQCDSMMGLVDRILHSLISIINAPADSIDILFFVYARTNNLFVAGSFLQIGLITGFFFLITIKMENIVKQARERAHTDVMADKLLRRLRYQNYVTASVYPPDVLGLTVGALVTVPVASAPPA